jgi:hypothetical protein
MGRAGRRAGEVRAAAGDLRFTHDLATGHWTLALVSAADSFSLAGVGLVRLITPEGEIVERTVESAALISSEVSAPTSTGGRILTFERAWPDGLTVCQRFVLAADRRELIAELSVRAAPTFTPTVRALVPLAPPEPAANLCLPAAWRSGRLLDFGWSAEEPVRSISLQPSESAVEHPAGEVADIVATGLAALGSADGPTALVFGLLDPREGVGTYRLRAGPLPALRIEAGAELGNVAVGAAGRASGGLAITFDALGSTLRRHAAEWRSRHRRPTAAVPTVIWQLAGPSLLSPSGPASGESILTALNVVETSATAPGRSPTGDIALVPAGWQEMTDGWEWPDSRFFSGWPAIFEAIKDARLRPGLSLALGLLAPDAPLGRDHPSWLLRTAAGDPVVATRPGGTAFVLDLGNPEVGRWLGKLATRIRATWGIELVELSHLTDLVVDGWRRAAAQSPLEAYRAGLRAFASAAPELFLLARSAPIFGSLDLMDLVQTDPRPLCRADPTPLLRSWLGAAGPRASAGPLQLNAPSQTLAEARAALTVAASAGGATVIAVDAIPVPPERAALLRLGLPPIPHTFYPLDPFTPNGPRLFGTPIPTENGGGLLLVVLNPTRQRSDVAVSLSALDLAGPVHAFEFWSQHDLGRIDERLILGPIEAGGCAVVALRPAQAVPQVIGTSLHVGMDLGVLREIDFCQRRRTLSIALGASGDQEGSISIALPERWAPGTARGTGGSYSLETVNDRLARLHLRFRDVADVEIDFWET